MVRCKDGGKRREREGRRERDGRRERERKGRREKERKKREGREEEKLKTIQLRSDSRNLNLKPKPQNLKLNHPISLESMGLGPRP